MLLKGGDHMPEICTNPIHLVDKGNGWNLIALGLTPNGFGLGLYSSHTAQYHHRSIQNAKRAFHFKGKIHVSWCIDDIH